MAKKRFYSQDERSMEARDSKMLSNDPSAVANLPRDVKYHAWPSSGPYMEYTINDTISGIDAQMRDDVGTAKRIKSGTKY